MAIKLRFWHSMPMQTVREALPRILWHKFEGSSPAAGTAALMLLVALRFMAEKVLDGGEAHVYIARSTYEDLRQATALSRSLVRQGLKRLEGLGLIAAAGSTQERCYRLAWQGASWFKLPCNAIIKDGVISPFKALTLRNKHELHAMKLYLYLASVRSGSHNYSVAAYETICRNTGISERDIPRAISILVGCGLMARVVRDHDVADDVHGPNRYYLSGYTHLSAGPASSPAGSGNGTASHSYNLHME